MKKSETTERVERVIRECRELDVEPTPRSVAEIMLDQDTHSRDARSSPEAATAYVEYRRLAARVLADA
jgi:hypothetical protein